MHTVHINFNFRFRLGPNVGLHIIHVCILYLRFSDVFYLHLLTVDGHAHTVLTVIFQMNPG